MSLSWIILSNSAEMREPKSRMIVADIFNNPQSMKIDVFGTLIRQDWIWLVPREAE